MAGTPTPKPKYKTYARGEAGSIPTGQSSGITGTPTSTPSYPTGGGNSKPKATTPTGNIGGSFPTTGGMQGYADASVTSIKEGKANTQGGSVLYSTTYKGGSGTKTTPSGQNINIVTTPTPAAAQEARAAILASKNPNELSQTQLNDLQAYNQEQARRQQNKTNREEIKRQVEQLANQGQQFQRLDYANGKLIINTQASNTEIGSQTYTPEPLIQTNNFYAPKQTNQSETQPVISNLEFNPFPNTDVKYGGEITPYNPADYKPKTITGEKATADFLTFSYLPTAESNFNQFINPDNKPESYKFLTLAAIPVSYGFGLIEGASDVGKGVGNILLGKQNPEQIAEGIVKGTGEQISNTLTALETGNLPQLSKELGKIKAQTELGKIGEKAAALPKKAFVDFGKDIAFKEMTYSEKAPYSFETPNPTDKNTFLNPPEYTELLGTKTLIKPEELAATKLEGAQNTPGYWLEFSKNLELKNELNNKPPELQSKLGIEITPPRTELTPEQVIEINKQTTQTGLKTFLNKKGQASGQILVPIERGTNKIIEAYKRAYEVYKQGGSPNELNNNAPNAAELNIGLPFNINFANQPAGINKITSFSGLTIPGKIIPGNKLSTNLNLTNIQSPMIKPRNINRQNNALGQTQSLGQSQTQEQTQAQAQTPIQTIQITSQQAQKIRQQNKLELKTEKNPRPLTPSLRPKNENAYQKTGGLFETKVRTRGNFKTIATENTISGAFQAGLNKTRNTAAASFKIINIKTGETINNENLPNDFSFSKRESGVIIQKRGRRISTTGEKTEITRKGIFSNKQRLNKTKVKTWGF